MSINNTEEIDSSNDNENAKNALKEKVTFILRMAGVEDLGIEFDELIPTPENLENFFHLSWKLAKDIDSKKFFDLYFSYWSDGESRIDPWFFKHFCELVLDCKLELFSQKQLENYRPTKSNKERLESKQQLKSVINGRFVEADLKLEPENLRSMVDSSLQLLEDVLSLPKEKRDKAYKLGENRILSVFNPPGKSMGAAGNN